MFSLILKGLKRFVMASCVIWHCYIICFRLIHGYTSTHIDLYDAAIVQDKICSCLQCATRVVPLVCITLCAMELACVLLSPTCRAIPAVVQTFSLNNPIPALEQQQWCFLALVLLKTYDQTYNRNYTHRRARFAETKNK